MAPSAVRSRSDATENTLMILDEMKMRESLDLRNFIHDDVGLRAIAWGLKTNGRLTELDLGSNRICHSTLLAFAEALKHNTTLRVLGLGANRIGNRGVEALADALDHNENLTKLKLGGNPIPFRSNCHNLASESKINKRYSGNYSRSSIHGNLQRLRFKLEKNKRTTRQREEDDAKLAAAAREAEERIFANEKHLIGL